MGFRLQIRMSTLKRSGSHAVLNWIVSLYHKTDILFVNDIPLGSNPLNKRKYNNIPLLKNQKRSGSERVLLFGHEDRGLRETRDSITDSQRREWFGDGEMVDVILLRDPLNCFAGKWVMETEHMPNYHPSIINPKTRPEVDRKSVV